MTPSERGVGASGSSPVAARRQLVPCVLYSDRVPVSACGSLHQAGRDLKDGYPSPLPSTWYSCGAPPSVLRSFVLMLQYEPAVERAEPGAHPLNRRDISPPSALWVAAHTQHRLVRCPRRKPDDPGNARKLPRALIKVRARHIREVADSCAVSPPAFLVVSGIAEPWCPNTSLARATPPRASSVAFGVCGLSDSHTRRRANSRQVARVAPTPKAHATSALHCG